MKVGVSDNRCYSWTMSDVPPVRRARADGVDRSSGGDRRRIKHDAVGVEGLCFCDTSSIGF